MTPNTPTRGDVGPELHANERDGQVTGDGVPPSPRPASSARRAEPERRPRVEDAPAPPEPGALRGEIPRTALDDVLDRGPGAFLRSIEVSPHFRDRRFTGWELVRIEPADRFDGVDLRPGDIIVTVNDHHIVRPRHLHALWNELRTALAIVVRAERDGRPFELRFDVVDPSGTGP